MKMSIAAARGLLVALGVKPAAKLEGKEFQTKFDKVIASFKQFADADTVAGLEDANVKKLVKDVQKALKAKEPVELSGEEGDVAAPKAVKGEVKKAVAAAGKGEEPAAEGGKKKGKGGFPKKAGGDGKPGVIDSIVEFLAKASKTKPLTKKAVLDKLAERFPDRDRDSMGKTVAVQIPNRIKTDKGIAVEKNENGYWIDEVPAGHPVRSKIKLS